MPQHFRIGSGRQARCVYEKLNPRMGFFYTVRRVLFRGRTRFQKIELVDTEEFGKTLLLDGVTQVAERGHFQYHETLVHAAMCAHPRPRDVLVIGGGDGGTLHQVVKYRSLRRIVLVELDKDVVAFSRQYLTSVHHNSFEDRRVELAFTDGRSYVEANPGRFDVIIMDMTDPSGPSRLLYTKEFFLAVRRCLRTASGVFAMHTESPVSRPLAFGCIQATLRSAFNRVTPYYLFVQMYATLWSISICSPTVDQSRRSAAAIDARLLSRGIRGLRHFEGSVHRAMLTPYPPFSKLLKRNVPLIRDRKPDFPDRFSRRLRME